jgi:tetratricopeptide (TPR) repeat protein
MNTRRCTSVLTTIPFLIALVLLIVVNVQVRQRWAAEEELRSAMDNMRQSQWQPALQSLETANKQDPANAYYYSNLALVHERMAGHSIEPFTLEHPAFSEDEMGHLRAAVQSYQNTLRLNPSDDAAQHNLAWLYWFLRDDNQAIEHAQRAVELDRSSYLYHVSLGLLHELSGDKAAAFADYETAVYLSPGLLDSRFFRDLRRRSPNEVHAMIDEVTAKLETRLQNGFDPPVAGRLGRLYMQPQPQRSLDLLSAAITALPNLSRPWANLGRLYELRGDKQRMKECYERALFLDGSQSLAWYRLGSYYEELNQPQEAARCYERAVNAALKPDSNHFLVVRRIYVSGYAVPDDVVPEGLLSYIAANLDLPEVCRRLAGIYSATGNAERAKYFAELGEHQAREIDFSSGADAP